MKKQIKLPILELRSKKPSAPYWFRYTSLTGKQERENTKTDNYAEAEEYQLEFMTRLMKAKTNGLNLTTLEQCLEIYLDSLSTRSDGTKSREKSNSNRLMGRKYRKQGGGFFAVVGLDPNMYINDIDNVVMLDFLRDLDKEGMVQPNSAAQIIGTLNRAIDHAQMRKYEIPEDVEWKKLRKVAKTSKRVRPFSFEEEAGLLEWIRNSKNKENEDLMILLFDSGMRIGEARKLRWNNVNLKTKKITVVHYKTETSGEKTSEIEMTKRLKKILKKRNKARVDNNPWVFPSDREQGYIAYSNNWFVTAMKELGFNSTDRLLDTGNQLTIKSTRSSYANRLRDAGVAVAHISALMGHTSSTITENAYFADRSVMYASSATAALEKHNKKQKKKSKNKKSKKKSKKESISPENELGLS